MHEPDVFDYEQELEQAEPNPQSAEPGSPLARARCMAHSAFDPMWQSGKMSRSEAYTWLARQLSIPKHRCHMLQFDIEMCNRVVEVCTANDFEDLS
jgi:hypothetical protein